MHTSTYYQEVGTLYYQEGLHPLQYSYSYRYIVAIRSLLWGTSTRTSTIPTYPTAVSYYQEVHSATVLPLSLESLESTSTLPTYPQYLPPLVPPLSRVQMLYL